MPLFFLPWTTSVLELNKQLLLIAVSGTALISWLLGIVTSGKLSWRGNSLNNGVVTVLGGTALATLFSIAKFKSLVGLTGSLSNSLSVILALSVFYIVAVNVVDDKGKRLVSLVSFSLVLAMLFGLLNILNISIFRYIDILNFASAKGFNPVGSLNSLGILAAVSLPLFRSLKLQIPMPGRKARRNIDISKFGMVLALALLIVLNWRVLW